MDLEVPLIHIYQFVFFYTPPLFSLHSGPCFIESSINWELALGLEFQSEGSSVVYSGLSFLYLFFFTEFAAAILHNRQDSVHIYFLFL